MADNFIQLPADGAGKKLDTEQLTVGANTVERERMQISGAVAAEIARILATDPAGTDYGLVVRQAPPVSPQFSYVTSASLTDGSSVNLDAATIPAATTGKLLKVTVASTAACRWVIKTRDGAVEVIVATLFTGGIVGRSTMTWKPSTKEMATLAGAGVDENFRVTATNLSGSTLATADVHATIEWDEI